MTWRDVPVKLKSGVNGESKRKLALQCHHRNCDICWDLWYGNVNCVKIYILIQLVIINAHDKICSYSLPNDLKTFNLYLILSFKNTWKNLMNLMVLIFQSRFITRIFLSLINFLEDGKPWEKWLFERWKTPNVPIVYSGRSSWSWRGRGPALTWRYISWPIAVLAYLFWITPNKLVNSGCVFST